MAQNLENADGRVELSEGFHRNYGFDLEVEHRPIDSTLGILLKLHSRRSADFVPLSMVTNLLDARDLRADPETKTRIGKEITLVLEGVGARKKVGSQYRARGFRVSNGDFDVRLRARQFARSGRSSLFSELPPRSRCGN